MVNPVINPTPHINKILSHDTTDNKICENKFSKKADITISIIMIIVIAVSVIIAIIRTTKKDD